MAADRFVKWEDARPTKDEIHLVLVNFLGDAARQVYWDKDRFFVLLRGSKTFPFKGLGNSLEEGQLANFAPPHDERSIEVHVSTDTLDVITRLADEYTCVLADGIARMFARYWEGRLVDY